MLRATAWTMVIVVLSSCASSDRPGRQSDRPATGIALPARIVASIAPYRSVEDALAAASAIDWEHDASASTAITTAFAVRELREHLRMGGIDVEVSETLDPSRPAIVLGMQGAPIQSPASASTAAYRGILGDQGFAITPSGGSVYITAESRIGLLYGSYALLERLGFAWDDPYETYVPSNLRSAIIDAQPSVQSPRVRLRGFWVYGEKQIPDEFALWLARNRLNLGGRARPELQKVLGLQSWGGHHDLLQQEFSRPGLFEAHPSWFAMIKGARKPVTADVEDV